MKHPKVYLSIIAFLIGLMIVWLYNVQLIVPFIDFVIVLLFTFYVWTAISPKLQQQKPSFKSIITFFYWLPLAIIFVGSVTLFVFKKLDDWPPFLRIYFIGGLLTYIFSLILPVLFLFFSDLLRGGQKLLALKDKPKKHIDVVGVNTISRKRFLVNTGLSLGGMVLGTMGYGMLHGNYHFKIWKHQLRINRVSSALKGLRIVQISDMHLGTWASKEPLKQVVDYINNLKPDMVFFTGDLVNARTLEAFPFITTLKKIEAKYGVYATLGNHDYGHYYRWKSEADEQKNWDDLLSFYEDLGWRLLRNENEKLLINGEKVQIIGVENWSQNPRFPQKGDLMLAADKNYDAKLNLLLSHDPTHWEQKVKQFEMPVDITFSGHTHGFQFGIESDYFRWSPAQYIYKHWAGIYQDETTDIYLNVNRGIGAIGFPGRVGIKPEISLIEII